MRNLIWLAILTLNSLWAQDFNPWNTQVGARGHLMGGAMGGRVPDNAMAFYNPADLSLIPQNAVSLNASLYNYNNYFFQDGLGKGNSVPFETFNQVPVLLSATWVGKKSGLRWNASLFNAGFTDVNMVVNEIYGPADTGLFQLRKTHREDWYTFGAAYQLNKYLSVGLMPAVVASSLDYQRMFLHKFNNGSGPDYTADQISLSGFHLGMLFNAGITFSWESIILGMSVKSPMVTLGLFSGANYSRSWSSANDNLSIQSVKSSDFNIQRPWDISIYSERKLLGYLWTARVGYISSTGVYNMVQSNQLEEAVVPVSGTREVINFAIATEVRLFQKVGLLTSFRTDFNNLHADLYNSNRVVPAFSRWNLYHLTIGGLFETHNIMAEAGLRYAFANQANLPAFADFGNLNSAASPPNLQTPETMLAKSTQVSLVLGFIFRFGDVEPQRIFPNDDQPN
jgi:hypothetical protein